MQTLHGDEAPKLECSYMCVEQIAINHLYLIANLKSFHSNIFVKMTNHDLMQDFYFFIINFNEIRISFFPSNGVSCIITLFTIISAL